MKSLTTWQDFSDDSSKADRGQLAHKQYDDGIGPRYTYTSAGRLESRTWARGIVTSYSYNEAGQLTKVDYSDETPDILYGYDRLGRKLEVTDAVGTHTYTYTDAGQVDVEGHTEGPLTGWFVDYDYDPLHRRTDVRVKQGDRQQALTHCPAGRFHTIGDGTNTATYQYVANSSRVQHITFSQRTEGSETARSEGSGSEASTPGSEDVMRSSKSYDGLERLSRIWHQRLIGDQAVISSYAYTYNDTNQRVRVDEEDGKYWLYGYVELGQVTGGIKYASDGQPLPATSSATCMTISRSRA